MQKELIVSSNRLETKVAILEDGQVMELFIERSENKGILGNIYKGRVTRVLPGMQSAFIDIGLDRDTFLYVTDFFEEMEEYERLYTTPSEESGSGAERPDRDRSDRDRSDRGSRRRGREERPRQPERSVAPIELPETEIPEALTAALESADELPGDAEVRAALEEWFSGSHLEPGSAPHAAGSPEAARPDQGPESPGGAAWPAEVAEAPVAGVETGSKLAVSAAAPRPDPEATADLLPPPQADVDQAPLSRTEAAEPVQAAALLEPEPSEPAVRTAISGRRRGAEKSDAAEPLSDSIEPRDPPVRNSRGRRGSASTFSTPSAGAESVPAAEAEKEVKEEDDASVAPPSRESNFESRPPHRKPSGNRRRGSSRRRNRPEKGESAPRQTISDLLREGQEIMVQVAKEPIARKGARVTSYVALPGRFLVYMPTVEHVGVSRKIDSEAERQRLRRLMTELRAGIPGGFIVRTACEARTREEIETDIKYLFHLWEEIRVAAEKASAPSLVHREMGLVQKILRDQLSEEFRVIRVDDEEEYARILDFLNRYQPSFINRVKLFTKDNDIFDEYGVAHEINRALESKIWLKSGGYIVINQTEALVAIDVNTGKFVGKGDNLEETITKTNMDAVKEVIRQIRLRDLGGIIVIDFIDMEERKNRHRVMELLQQEIARDKAPSKVLEFNEFGLVAITRKRVKQSLEKTFCQPCAYCNGTGMVKSLTTTCYQIQAEVQKIRRHMETDRDVSVRVHPEVARALRGSESKVLEEIELLLGRELSIKQDPTIHISQFDIVC